MITTLASVAITLACAVPNLALVDSSETWFFGDSIGVGLDIGADHHDSVPGRPMDWVPVPDMAPGDIFVVELGVNDYVDDPLTWASQVQTVVEDVPIGVCLWWVSPYMGDRPDLNARFAALLYLMVPSGPCGGVIPWHLFAVGHPEWMPRDSVHPEGYGKWALALLIQQSVHPDWDWTFI